MMEIMETAIFCLNAELVTDAVSAIFILYSFKTVITNQYGKRKHLKVNSCQNFSLQTIVIFCVRFSPICYNSMVN